ncbi:MAG: hypothetical protein R6U44_10120 [Archaeoglobaceae archaeon]
MRRLLLIVVLAVALAGCGGTHYNLLVTKLVPPSVNNSVNLTGELGEYPVLKKELRTNYSCAKYVLETSPENYFRLRGVLSG